MTDTEVTPTNTELEVAMLRSDLAHAHERIAMLQEALLARTTTLHLLENKARNLELALAHAKELIAVLKGNAP